MEYMVRVSLLTYPKPNFLTFGQYIKSRWWFQIFFMFLGKWSNLTNIFQTGWNHQLENGSPEKFNFLFLGRDWRGEFIWATVPENQFGREGLNMTLYMHEKM